MKGGFRGDNWPRKTVLGAFSESQQAHHLTGVKKQWYVCMRLLQLPTPTQCVAVALISGATGVVSKGAGLDDQGCWHHKPSLDCCHCASAEGCQTWHREMAARICFKSVTFRISSKG